MAFYDDLKTDLRREIDSIIKFLRVAPTFVDCALKDPRGKFQRKKKTTTAHAELFDEKLTAIAKDNIHKVYDEAFSRKRVSNGVGLV